MGLSGLEPPTSRLSGVRSNRLSYKPGEIKNFFEICYRNSKFLLSFGAERSVLPRYSTRQLYLHARFEIYIYLICKSNFHCFSGDGEIRTLDPLLARQVLSQLSYTPREITNFFEICYRNSKFLLSFGAERFELPRYSTRQLSLTFFADFQSFSSFGAKRPCCRGIPRGN